MCGTALGTRKNRVSSTSFLLGEGERGLYSFVSTGCNLFWSQPISGGVEKKETEKEIGVVVRNLGVAVLEFWSLLLHPPG